MMRKRRAALESSSGRTSSPGLSENCATPAFAIPSLRQRALVFLRAWGTDIPAARRRLRRPV